MNDPTPKILLKRRDLLISAGAGLVAATLAGCDLSTDPAGGSEGTPTGPGGGPRPKEAPDLAAMVQRGQLPPLDQRLPSEPLVVQPAEELGQYGGELNMVMLRAEVPDYFVYTTIGYEQLLRWDPEATDLTADALLPNIAREWEVSDNGAVYTFALREGMRWSDGEPFTADDIVFWYDDVVTNKELTPVWPGEFDASMLTPSGPVVVEKEDDYTVVFRFPEPHGLFLVSMATLRGALPTRYPAHYLKKFHKKYTPNVEQQARQAGYETLLDFFESKSNISENAELPTLNAWTLTAPVGASAQRVVAERNPYYWKTDSDGSQLPYIDRVVYDLVEDAQAAVLKVASGEVDLVERGVNELRNKPVFDRDKERGNYRFFDTTPQEMNQMIIMVNLTHRNPALREVFGNKDFRIGLSHAFDRQEIIDTVYQQQGEPWQAAPRPDSEFYNEELAKQYTEYDPDLANEHLDRVVPQKNAQGIRLLPDGRELSFQVMVGAGENEQIDAMELVQQQWAEVGVKVTVQPTDFNLFITRLLANEHDAAVTLCHGGLGVVLDRMFYMPFGLNSMYALPWDKWYREPDNAQAEEPPEPTKRQFELEQEILATADPERQRELMNEILQIAVDQFYCMGVALRSGEYGIASNNLRNAPSSSLVGWLHSELMPTNPQQYFFAEGS
jgi:peptide/nickel transport system substrate-binding protein